MFVDPDRWRKGVGSALLLHAVEEMRRRGYQQAQLYTAEGNADSRRFYEHHGWQAAEGAREWQGLRLVRYTLDLTTSAR